MDTEYGVISITATYMVIQKGARPRTEIEIGWTGKEIKEIEKEINERGLPMWGVNWVAEVKGDKIICLKKEIKNEHLFIEKD